MVGSIDYAIIGGGVAGTYSGWRLKLRHPEKKIALFEYSDRIGGRLLTVRLPKSNIKIELGGMRFKPKQHPIFTKLVDEFKLDTELFLMGYDSSTDKKSKRNDPNGTNNYAYFRHKRFRIRDFKNPRKVPFNVKRHERGKSPDDLQYLVMKKLIPDSDKLENLDDWFDVKVFGDYLWNFGFWNLLYRVLSPEAYQLLKFGSGYDTNVSNGNAVTLLPTGDDYSSKEEYLTLKEGMMTLPCRLCHEFEILGGEVHLLHRLDSIDKDENQNYKLTFVKTKAEEGKREKIMDTETSHVITARNVILALPKAAIEKIRWKPIHEDNNVKEMMNSVLTQDAIKIFLQYERAWWKSQGLFRGRSITDLPIRQTYYFTDLEDLDKPDSFKIHRKPAGLMASYSDIESVPFWRVLEGAEKDEPFPGPSEGYKASKLMVQEAHQQVMDLHGLKKISPPSAAAYYDWADMPYGAAWHCWRAGYQYNKIIDQIRHPVKQEKVYICGESYSGDQGWAEGALRTAEDLLTRDLDPDDCLDSIFGRSETISGIRRGQVSEEYKRKDAKGRYY